MTQETNKSRAPSAARPRNVLTWALDDLAATRVSTVAGPLVRLRKEDPAAYETAMRTLHDVYHVLFGSQMITPWDLKQEQERGSAFTIALLQSRGLARNEKVPGLSWVSYEQALNLFFHAFRRAYQLDDEFPWDEVPQKEVQVAADLYPDVKDPHFHQRLYWKREFHDKHSNFDGLRFEDLCEGTRPFTLFPYQKFLRNLFSVQTPYNGLLLFHSTGSGKTCTAITIAEEFREVLEGVPGPQRKILVLLPVNRLIEANFVQTLHDPKRVERETALGLEEGSLHCLQKVYPTVQDPRAPPPKGFAEDLYDIQNFERFRKNLLELKERVTKNLPSDDPELAQQHIREAIREQYSNRIILVDEAHNLKRSKWTSEEEVEDANLDQGRGKTIDALQEVLQTADNIRIVLLTATPVYDRLADLAELFNLLLVNDREPRLASSRLFQLASKEEAELGTTAARRFTLAPGAEATLARIARRYVSYVRGNNPITFPRILEVNDPLHRDLYETSAPTYVPRRARDGIFRPIPATQRHTDQLVLVHCPMEEHQYLPLLEAMRRMRQQRTSSFGQSGSLQYCNIVFPSGRPGNEGFYDVFRKVREQGPFGEPQFEYVGGDSAGFLKRIGQYSSKYARLLQNLERSPGIAFVSTFFLETAAYTIAMLLETDGYENFHGQPLLLGNRVPAGDKRCAICNARRRHHDGTHDFLQAKYAVVAGLRGNGAQMNTPLLQQEKVLRMFKDPSNVRGHKIKVLIGTQVTNEGVDFAHVRQVHLMSPWWNLSRITQIVGRAARSCSHRALPAEERNVTVFRYAAAPPSEPAEQETPDEWAWRTALLKDFEIKRVERILKENAIDCELNRGINEVPDGVAGSRACDYDSCMLKCHFTPKDRATTEIDDSTFQRVNEPDQVRTAERFLAELYRTRSVYTLEEMQTEMIRRGMVMEKRFLYQAIESFLYHQRRPKVLHDVHGRPGTLQYVRQHYVFLPSQFAHPQIPLSLRLQAPFITQGGVALQRGEMDETRGEGEAWDEDAWRVLLRSGRPAVELHKQLDEAPDGHWVRVLELAIRHFDLATVPGFLPYFRHVLVVQEMGAGSGAPFRIGWYPGTRVRGHALGKRPVCWEEGDGVWRPCASVEERAVAVQRWFREPRWGPIVGYREGPSMKLLDITEKKKVSATTILPGKRCTSYLAEDLLVIAKMMGISPEVIASLEGRRKDDICAVLEDALRERQIQADLAGTSVRVFFHRLDLTLFAEIRASRTIPFQSV